MACNPRFTFDMVYTTRGLRKSCINLADKSGVENFCEPRSLEVSSLPPTVRRLELRPISLLKLFLLRYVDSSFRGNSQGHESSTPKNQILLESNPLKFRILVRRLAVAFPLRLGTLAVWRARLRSNRLAAGRDHTPNLPTKIIPTKIA